MPQPQGARGRWSAALRSARRSLLAPTTIVAKVLRYAVAAALVGSALAVQVGIYSRLRPAPFLLLFPAVYFATWLAGRGPGWFAVALAAVAGHYAFIEPRFTFTVDASSAVTTVLFRGARRPHRRRQRAGTGRDVPAHAAAAVTRRRENAIPAASTASEPQPGQSPQRW